MPRPYDFDRDAEAFRAIAANPTSLFVHAAQLYASGKISREMFEQKTDPNFIAAMKELDREIPRP